MATTTQTPTTRQSKGRLYLWLGLAAPFIGIAMYALQLYNHVLKMPWYLPVFGTIGLLLVVLALFKKRNIGRFIALGLVILVAGLEWVVVSSALALPAYTGPVAAGKPFPAFTATLADGSPFTPDSFRGHDTALVFFRGRW